MSKKPIEKVPGYGSKLRARLKAAKMSQTGLAQATGLSRQTIANALKDEVSERTAGLIDDVLRASPARSRSDLWATATQIGEWADRREAQEELPRLVRRLVLVTTASATTVSFRAAEGVQLSGFDGRVESTKGSAFTPAGLSVWELSTASNPLAKANENYSKRTSDRGELALSDTTFVFVTARRWPGKDEWTAHRKAEGRWKDVRAYDADDLETWLEQAPSVHVWFSTRIGVIPRECIDLDSWWTDWQLETSPPLGAAFLLAGRAAGADAIEKKLGSGDRIVPIRAESQQEAIAFFAATLEVTSTMDRDEMFARSVVVVDPSAWRYLAATRAPLILIPTFDAGDQVGTALEGAHTIVLPLGAADGDHDDAVDVGVIAREPAVEILDPKKTGPREEAWERASLARRSMTAFRRVIGNARLRKPDWAEASVGWKLIAPLFVSSWIDDRHGDQAALATLAGLEYEQFTRNVLPFTNTTDPLLRRRGQVWYLVSPHDAWRQLGGHVTTRDLERFERLALEILGVVDPRLELAPDKRWMAGVLLPTSKWSPAIRRGIASTIGLVGSFAQSGEPGFNNEALHGFADSLVRRVFDEVRREPRLWASLDDHLPDLAEGAPDVFLRELERALDDPTNPLSVIFTDADNASLFGPSSPHVDVLWALERLAWSPRYLARVVHVLGRLDGIDPQGKTTNRPRATLRAIFLPWLPQTAATVDQRLEVLKGWIPLDPRASWITLLSMLPEMHGVGHYSARPRWRDWSEDDPKPVTNGEYWNAVRFAASKLIELAGTDGGRWAQIISSLSHFPEPEHDAALQQLGEFDVVRIADADRDAIWDALRTLVANHRNFPSATWAMPPERVKAIDALRERFAPRDLVARFSWLFSHRPQLPDATSSFEDFSAYDAEIDLRRREAVAEILRDAGVAGLVAVADKSENAQALGFAVARLGALDGENEFIEAHLGGPDRNRDQLAWGYLGGRVTEMGDVAGRTWLLEKFNGVGRTWSARQRAYLLLVQKPTRDTWNLVSTDTAVAHEYWAHLHPFMVADTDVEEATRQYLAFRRSFAAIELLGHHAQKLEPDRALMLEVLEAAVFGKSEDKPDGMFSYYVEKLFDALGVGSSRVDLQACKLEYSIVSPK